MGEMPLTQKDLSTTSTYEYRAARLSRLSGRLARRDSEPDGYEPEKDRAMYETD